MPLLNFGTILGFAAELEAADQEFYRNAAKNPACAQHQELFETFARDEKKNEQTLLRSRREHVTEMILEQIPDFTRAPFLSDRTDALTMNMEETLAKSIDIEEKAESFYLQAAEKITALREVSLLFERLAKRRTAHKEQLASLK
ncbi:MAG: hypothetical protein HOC71_03585 [Candidatus Latescibacteria bacterium]|jgi:rubrerythrin|nr:hypothetical protein [Candidatus Latescibacterota bacterium]